MGSKRCQPTFGEGNPFRGELVPAQGQAAQSWAPAVLLAEQAVLPPSVLYRCR